VGQYLEAMTAVVFEHGGTLDKFIGDAVMAFWNAPLDDPAHARHACEAALAMPLTSPSSTTTHRTVRDTSAMERPRIRHPKPVLL
jgi:class 3 adenylate cyclase